MIHSTTRRIVYSVEHFYPKHPGHPIAPLTAEHRGFFREEGVASSALAIAGDDTGSIDLLLEGKTAFSMDAHPAMVIEANAAGKDLYIIGSYRNGLPFGIAALTGKVSSPSDLKGKRLATNRRYGAGERMTRAAFSSIGLDPDKELGIALIHNEGMAEKMDALREGRADFLVYHYNNPMGLEVNLAEGEVETVLDLSALFPDYVVRSMTTTGRMIREEPETVKAFIKGVMRAHLFMKHEDPSGQAVMEVLARALNIPALEGSDIESGIPKTWFLEPQQVIASTAGIKAHIEDLKTKGGLDPRYSVERVVQSEPALLAAEELKDIR
jgi:ABC-type nitrate/sulfonate/bicarbonate transport system substrate-binding protein